jgi:phosphatidylglycerol:prolipoprotein diacylglycerol transferase
MWPLIHLGADIPLPTYMLVSSLATCLGIYLAYRLKPSLDVLNLSLTILVSGFFGARIFHILYEEPRFYWEHPSHMFFIWEGGFVWYGGMLAAGLATYGWCRAHRQAFLPWADFFAPVLAISYGVGRLSCFFSGCCYGQYWRWGLVFPSHRELGLPLIPRHPTQLYMFGGELVIAALLLWQGRQRLPTGTVFFTWLLLHGAVRLAVESLRGDFRGPLIFGMFSVASALSVALMFGAALGLQRVHKYRSKAGV